MPAAIEVQGLVKRFGDFTAVRGLDLQVERGELLSMLGPNGAGKSTTIRVLTTLMPATEGTIRIHGLRVPQDNARIKPLLGLVPQEIALYETLNARNNLRFFARLYGHWGSAMEQRVTELLEAVELLDRADDVPVSSLSGGMQRRVNIAAALVHDPEIIFMDEPTVGLDPVTREAIWRIIERLKARGKTIILTTHYMEEAEALCDRVAIVDHGRVIAQGTPAELVRKTGISTVLNLGLVGDGSGCLPGIRAVPDVREAALAEDHLSVTTSAGSKPLPAIIQMLLAAGVEVRNVDVSAPNLGAVYLHYTGRSLRD